MELVVLIEIMAYHGPIKWKSAAEHRSADQASSDRPNRVTNSESVTGA
jgi:hypothetical protein